MDSELISPPNVRAIACFNWLSAVGLRVLFRQKSKFAKEPSPQTQPATAEPVAEPTRGETEVGRSNPDEAFGAGHQGLQGQQGKPEQTQRSEVRGPLRQTIQTTPNVNRTAQTRLRANGQELGLAWAACGRSGGLTC